MVDPQSIKYGAIHRAVLSGLLGNIGQKTEPHQYTGLRANRFGIFPGSGLFRHPPAWIVAAELVETGKLYARTVARIEPGWIERLADHLVQRTYSEIRWDPEDAEVIADEKVTLHGLVIIPSRPVPYGPVDSKVAREHFIHSALVEGRYRTDAAFFAHNAKLVAEIEKLEAKTRKRDVLVEADARFAFYAARIPAGVYNGVGFERWRRGAERRNPRLLFMTRQELMRHGAADVTATQFPDSLQIGTLSLPLSYHLEPGHPEDGVTATVPLTMLNQLPEARFQWLVPGMLREKLTALIKSLPRPLRTQFVPAPDSADKVAANLKFAEGPLLDAAAHELGKISGSPVPTDQFDLGEMPDHLRMNFRVIDERGRQVAMGRDLAGLRRTLEHQVRRALADLPPSAFNRANITSWDFGDLPEHVQITRHGMNILGYPALVEEEDQTVSLRLMESPRAASAAMRGGLRRLFMVQCRKDVRDLSRHLPGLQEMSLHYARLGPAEQLRDQLVEAIVDRAFLRDNWNIRTQDQFVERAAAAWRTLPDAAEELCPLVGRILAEYHNLGLQLEKPLPSDWRPAIADIRQQLAMLLPPDFVTATPPQWLGHVPRYLKAITVRLRKLAEPGLARDTRVLNQIAPFVQQLLEKQRHLARPIDDPELTQFRWMLEELRVSLFAQELKTPMSISPERLSRQWEKIG